MLRFRKVDAGLVRTAPDREDSELPLGQLRWAPRAGPRRAAHLPHRPAHGDDRRRRRNPDRHGARTSPSSPAPMADEYFSDADGELLVVAQDGRLALRHRVRRHRHRPGRGLRHPARRRVQGRAAGRAGPRLRLRELRRRLHAARARPDRRQLPRQPARLPGPRRRLRGPGRARHPDDEVGRRAAPLRAAPVAARRRRLARQLLPLQVRPAPLLAGRPAPLRPRRPVDLHRDDRPVRDARHGQRRLRDLPRPLDGGGGHLPAALVPPQHHVGVHGPRVRRLRRQARRLQAGRRSASTT